jgi:hypothetical protein
MTNVPFPTHYISEADEMRRLFDHHNMGERVGQCRPVQKLLTTEPYHRTFCCTMWSTEFFDDSDTQVATINRQEKIDGRIIEVVQMFHTGAELYVLAFPAALTSL